MPIQPNIVIINPDQMRWDYASCYGHPFIDTRNLDRLAARGTRFDRAFVACPMCGPSRTSFVTGQYPIEHDVRNYAGNFDPAKPNALSLLNEAGYVRGLWGKDHLISDNAIGILYDEGEDICLGNMDEHPSYIHSYDSAILETDSPWNLTQRLTDGALGFIDRHSDRPFYVTINYQDPHPFFACPEPWASLFRPEQFSLPPNFRREPVDGEIRRLSHWRIHSGEAAMPEESLKKAMAIYAGQIRYVDDQIGRVLAKLEEKQILDQTIVLFWSDHGEFLGDFGVTHKMPAFYDCLMRVPLVLWDPTGRVPRGGFSNLIEAMDVMATVLELCGLPQPAGSHARPISAPNFTPREEIFADAGLLMRQPSEPTPGLRLKSAQPPTSYGPGAMLRTEHWKLCEYAEDSGELFNLAEDPHEMRNLYSASQHQSVRSDLQRRLFQRLLCRGAHPSDLPEDKRFADCYR